MRFLDCIEVNPTVKLEKGKEYPFVEMANVDIYAREPKIIEMKKYTSGVKFQKGDTIVSRIEPCLQNGKGFYAKNINEGFGSTEFLVFRPKNEKVDNDFLYYLLLTDNIRKNMIGSMTGATGRQRVNNDIFNSLELSLPDIEIQKSIAGMLSAYDDLIENNHKQIKLMEEAAMRLYKEWFINLRFPGHETTKIVDGVPQGWTKRTIKEIGEVITGKTPSTTVSDYYGGTIPFIKIPDMHGLIYPLKTETTLTHKGANTQKNKYLPPSSIMVSCIATVGLVCIAHEVCQTNQQINSIILYDDCHLYYTFFKMKGIRSLLEGVGSNGATMTNVNKTKFENIELVLPEIDILIKFNRIVKPIFDCILANSKQNNRLVEARDKLLPKLMNGEIEV